MTKASKKSGRVLTDLSVVDPARLGVDLVNSCMATSSKINALRAETELAVGGVQSSLLDIFAQAAARVPGLTEKAFEASIAPAMKARYQELGVKSWATQASIGKVALLALANGIAPTKDETSLHKFVQRARDVCKVNGIIARVNGGGAKKGNENAAKPAKAANKVGRPVGSVDTGELLSDRETAAQVLAQTDTDMKQEVIAERTRMLLIMTKPAHWRKLEAFLIAETSKPGVK